MVLLNPKDSSMSQHRRRQVKSPQTDQKAKPAFMLAYLSKKEGVLLFAVHRKQFAQ